MTREPLEPFSLRTTSARFTSRYSLGRPFPPKHQRSSPLLRFCGRPGLLVSKKAARGARKRDAPLVDVAVGDEMLRTHETALSPPFEGRILLHTARDDLQRPIK